MPRIEKLWGPVRGPRAPPHVANRFAGVLFPHILIDNAAARQEYTWRLEKTSPTDIAKTVTRIHCTNKMLATDRSAQITASDRAQAQSHVVDMNRLVP